MNRRHFLKIAGGVIGAVFVKGIISFGTKAITPEYLKDDILQVQLSDGAGIWNVELWRDGKLIKKTQSVNLINSKKFEHNYNRPAEQKNAAY